MEQQNPEVKLKKETPWGKKMQKDQEKVREYILASPGCTVAEMSKDLCILRPNLHLVITTLLNAEGLISEPDAEDGRVRHYRFPGSPIREIGKPAGGTKEPPAPAPTDSVKTETKPIIKSTRGKDLAGYRDIRCHVIFPAQKCGTCAKYKKCLAAWEIRKGSTTPG